MKTIHALTLCAAASCFAAPAFSQAQGGTGIGPAPLTRLQVTMERDEFLKTHRWDEPTEMWVLKSGVEPPVGVKSRLEVKQARDQFLANNRWDEKQARWIPLTGTPRNMSTLSRDTVKAETAQFTRTHEWDELTGQWLERGSRKATP
jgi:hypothetical protein